MDIKNVSGFFRRKGVDTLFEQTLFKFIISNEGPATLTESNDEMFEAIEKLQNQEASGEPTAESEIDTAVFRQQYIPQTLEQVYDIERDVEKVNAGEGSDLVYQDLLAGKPTPKDTAVDGGEQSDSDVSGGVSVSGSESEDEDEKDPFAAKAPRGKRFEDKDTKREHKQKVKEEKRDQRAKKMPKHMKKRMVSASSRKKK